MSTSFSALKKSSGASAVTKLAEQAAQLTSKKSYDDPRFWEPTVGTDGNGSAIFRFLPAPKGEDIPWARYWRHSFKGPGGWYIENSLTTLGQADPVSEANTVLWDTGIEANQKIARDRKRQLTYVSWIYVINDPKVPENNGKVFLYKYGKKIHDKIVELANPTDETETPVNVFDFWEGANFRLKIKKVMGYRNYDSSKFDSPTPLLADDKELENIWNQLTPLAEFTDAKKFKSYGELKSRLEKVLGVNTNGASRSAGPVLEDTSDKSVAEDDDKPPFDTDDTDDALAKFRAFADDDE
jgi:hypothetical protein